MANHSNPHRNHANRGILQNDGINSNLNAKSDKLRLSDQVYIIFYELGVKQLSFNELKSKLLVRFQRDIERRSLQQLSFIYISNKNIVCIFLQIDDICPNAANCKLPKCDCHRIHFINSSQICWKSIYHFESFECMDGCQRFHLFHQKMTNRLLGIILFRFNNYNKIANKNNVTLSEYYMIANDFITYYLEFHQNPPIPMIKGNNYNDDILIWRKIIDEYNKYYFDGEYANKSYVILWRTENYKQTWCIRINYDALFFMNRSCFDHIMHRNCLFHHHFCPLFHLHPNFVAIDGDCNDCNDAERRECDRFHIKKNDLSQSMMVIGNSFLRSNYEIKQELDEIEKNHAASNQIILDDLQYIDIINHETLCNQFNAMFNQYQYHQNYHHFHRFCTKDINQKKVITIKWKLNDMKKSMIGFSLISRIKDIFKSFNQTPIDIVIANYKKYIILNYTIYNYPIFASIFNNIFGSISIINNRNNANEMQLIIEFGDINTFCSVELIRRYFEELMVEYNKREIVNYMKYNEGSFHFIKKHGVNDGE